MKLQLFLIPLILLGLVVLSVNVQRPVTEELTIQTIDASIQAGGKNKIQWENLTYGFGHTLTPGLLNRLMTQNRAYITVEVDQVVELTVTEECDPTETQLLNGTLSMQRYMHIELNQSCIMNAVMFRNFTNGELSQYGNVIIEQAKWAYYNQTMNQWQYANENWVEITEDGISVIGKTDHFSLWTIIVPKVVVDTQGPPETPAPETPYDSTNGTPFQLQNGSLYQIKTQAGFELQLQFNASVQVNITETDETQKTIQNQFRNRVKAKFMNVEINITDYECNATLSKEFTDNELSQLQIQNRTQLRFAYHNDDTGEWVIPENQWHVGDKLYCNTTHFSEWTIVEEIEEDTDDDGTAPGFEFFVAMIGLLPLAVYLTKKQK